MTKFPTSEILKYLTRNHDAFEIIIAGMAAGIAFVAAVIAIWAISTSKEANRIAARNAERQAGLEERTKNLEALNTTATHLKEYVDLLAKCHQANDTARKMLATTAGDCLKKIANRLDAYPTKREGRYNAHLFHAMCNLLYKGYQRELAWQYALNLLPRFNKIRYINIEILSEKERIELEKHSEKHSLAKQATYEGNKDNYFEDVIIESSRFKLLASNLCESIPKNVQQSLYQEILELLDVYRLESQKQRPIFEESYKTLKRAYDKNKDIDIVKIRNSETLYPRYQREMMMSETLDYLHLEDTIHEKGLVNSQVIPSLIYIGTVLYTLQRSYDWGNASIE